MAGKDTGASFNKPEPWKLKTLFTVPESVRMPTRRFLDPLLAVAFVVLDQPCK